MCHYGPHLAPTDARINCGHATQGSASPSRLSKATWSNSPRGMASVRPLPLRRTPQDVSGCMAGAGLTREMLTGGPRTCSRTIERAAVVAPQRWIASDKQCAIVQTRDTLHHTGPTSQVAEYFRLPKLRGRGIQTPEGARNQSLNRAPARRRYPPPVPRAARSSRIITEAPHQGAQASYRLACAPTPTGYGRDADKKPPRAHGRTALDDRCTKPRPGPGCQWRATALRAAQHTSHRTGVRAWSRIDPTRVLYTTGSTSRTCATRVKVLSVGGPNRTDDAPSWSGKQPRRLTCGAGAQGAPIHVQDSPREPRPIRTTSPGTARATAQTPSRVASIATSGALPEGSNGGCRIPDGRRITPSWVRPRVTHTRSVVVRSPWGRAPGRRRTLLRV